MSTSTLALPGAVSKAVNPPPTKAEVIEALAIKKLNQLKEASLKSIADYEAADKAAKESIIAWMATDSGNKTSEASYSKWSENISIGVSIHSENPPSFVVKLIKAAVKASSAQIRPHTIPSLPQIRRDIRDALSNHTQRGDRIKLLLSDEKSSKQLDTMLAALDKPAAQTSV